MKKDCAKTPVSPALRRIRERSVRTPASALHGPTRTIKGKAKKTLKKKIRVSKTEHPNTSRGDVEVRGGKRTRLDLVKHDMETASCSADTESCNSSVDDVSKRGVKRKAVADGEGPSRKKGKSDLKETKADLSVAALTEKFKAKYVEQDKLGQGGCGSVFAGYRRADNLPVAIKRVPKDKILCKVVDQNGKQLSVEVAAMLKLAAGTSGSAGSTAPVALLDWYDLDRELILVLERPVPSKDLLNYVEDNGGSLPEEQAQKGSFYRNFYGTASHIPPEWYSDCMYRPSPTTVWQVGVVLFEMLHKVPFQTT
ncbi:hypothetical protein FQN60_000380, partial [Etheostoma spectabile]